MVARNDEYGHGGILQRVPQSLQTLGAVRAVEKVACKKDQIATAKALGLKKIGDVTVQPDNAQTQGKIKKISHLIEVTEA